jgi:AraC-like DNA-binding protein
MTEDYAQSLSLLDKCLLANNKNIPAHSVKTICLLKLGKYDEVINYFDTMPPEVVILGEKTGVTGLAYALKKDKENTALYLKQLTEQAKEPNGFTADSYLFLMYAVTGNTEKAFTWIEKAIKSKSSLLLFRYADPLVNPIKSDPRFIDFHKSIFKIDAKTKKVKAKKQLLDAATATAYANQLLKHLNENEPYLDPNLSLRTLAEQINIHPNQLSWLLNESIGKNFNEYINHFRIAAFKSIAKDPKNANITILGLAYDCGFNSKTVFNTYFKRETGLTPKQYLKQ